MIVPFSIKVDSRAGIGNGKKEWSIRKPTKDGDFECKKQPRLLTEQPTSLLEEKIEKRRRERKHQKHI